MPSGAASLSGAGVGTVAGDLDAMRLGQQHPEQLLGEVGVDAGVDGQLAARRDDVAHPVGLDDRRVRVLLHRGHLLAQREARGDDAHELAVELIDLLAQRGEVARRGHRATLATDPCTDLTGVSRAAATRASAAATVRAGRSRSARSCRAATMQNTVAHTASPTLSAGGALADRAQALVGEVAALDEVRDDRAPGRCCSARW